MRTAGERLGDALNLRPLPGEGGRSRETLVGDEDSSILFLLADGDFSALHRLQAREEYFFLAGSPLKMLVIDNAGPHEIVLDRQHPSVVVEPGWWQGSSSVGEWTLVSTTVTPPFVWSIFELGDRSHLQREHPGAATRIQQLTRID